MNNFLCLDRHPYFFIYRYADTRKKLKKHVDKYKQWCKRYFRLSLEELIELDEKTDKQNEFLKGYFKYMPVIDSNSVMNKICHYIEHCNIDIRDNMKIKESKDMIDVFKPDNFEWNQDIYNGVVKAYERYCKESKDMNAVGFSHFNFDNKNDQFFAKNYIGMLYSYVNEECSNVYDAVYYLAYYMYKVKDIANKEMLWKTYGKEIFDLIKVKNGVVAEFPMRNSDGDIEYLGEKYSMEKVCIFDR